MKVKVFMVSFKPFLYLRQQTLMVLLLCLLLGYSGCEGSKELAPKEVLDYIHIPHVHPTFEKADRFKYDVDYVPALETFTTIWHGTQLRNKEDSMYCLNQIAYLNLCMYKDSVAHIWIQKADAMMAHYGDTMSPGARGDYWYNKGIWAFRTKEKYTANGPLYEALNIYSDTLFYGSHKLRTAQCANTLGEWCTVFRLDSSYYFIKKANDFFESFDSSSIVHKFSGENLLNNLKLSSFDREIYKDDFVFEGINLIRNNKYIDSCLIGRLYERIIYVKSLTYMAPKPKGVEVTKLERQKIIKSHKVKFVRQIDSLYRIAQPCLINCMDYLGELNHTYGLFLAFHGKEMFKRFIDEQRKNEHFYFNADQLESMYYLFSYNKSDKRSRWVLEKSLECGLKVYNTENKYQKTTNLIIENNHYSLYKSLMGLKRFDNLALDVIKSDLTFGTPLENEAQNLSIKDLCTQRISSLKRYQIVNYIQLGNFFLESYQDGKGDQNLKTALEIFMYADSLTSVSVESNNIDAILYFLELDASKLYDNAMEALYFLHQKYPSDPKYPEIALKMAERRKSLLLFARLSEGNNPENEKLSTIIKRSKCYFDVQDLYSKLNKNQAIIDFYLSNEWVYALTVCTYPNKITFQKLTRIDTFQKNIKIFDSLYVKSFTDNYQHAIHSANVSSIIEKIYAQIVQPLYPAVKNKERWIIVNHQVTTLIPFDILFEKNNANYTFEDSDIPYLVKRHFISYAMSCLLHIHQAPPLLEKHSKAFFVATKDVDYKNSFTKDLSFMDCTKAKDHLSKKELIKSITEYDIIHIGLHGSSLSNEEVDSNLLILPNNIHLSSSEIGSIRFTKKPLVVLASCEAANGNMELSEGPFSVCYAFRAGGARAVIAPVYEINPAISVVVLKYFYYLLAQGYQPSTALTLAKRIYLASESEKNSKAPYFWGGLGYYY